MKQQKTITQNLIGLPLCLAGMVILLISLSLPIFIWLKYAEWIHVDLFSLYATWTIAPSCSSLNFSPLNQDICHSIAMEDFYNWIYREQIWKGLAIILNFIFDLWIGWYALLIYLEGLYIYNSE